ncbi:MAG: hypothetical protein V1495_10435 [Pseudomonadota bacterium]
MKSQQPFSDNWRKVAGFLQIVLLFLLGAGDALAQEVRLSREISPVRDNEATADPIAIRSDSRGFWTAEAESHFLTEGTRLDISATESLTRVFGDSRVNRTLESGLNVNLETRDQRNDVWSARFNSMLTQQDVTHLAFASDGHLFKQRTYSFGGGWRRMLTEGISLEFLAGFAQCHQADQKATRYLPFGGVTLTKEFGWGKVTADVSQVVEGGGSFSGLYGSQTRRQIGLNGAFALVKGLSLTWECGLAFVRGAFEEENLLRKAPMMVASALLEYELSPILRGEFGYTHRKLLGGPDRAHGYSGPMASATVTVRIF